MNSTHTTPAPLRSTIRPVLAGTSLLLGSLVGAAPPADAGLRENRAVVITDYADGAGVAGGGLSATVASDDEYKYIGCTVKSSNWYAWLSNYYTGGVIVFQGVVRSWEVGRFLSQQNLGDTVECWAKGAPEPRPDNNMSQEPRLRICTSVNPSLIGHALAISDSSYVLFSWDSNGECTALNVYNYSSHLR